MQGLGMSVVAEPVPCDCMERAGLLVAVSCFCDAASAVPMARHRGAPAV